MHSGESAATWTLLLWLTLTLGRLPHDPALCNDDNVLAAELLLQLTDQTGLDLVHNLQQTESHEDDHSGAAADIDLLSSNDVQLAELSLQVAAVCLQVAESLSHLQLEG